MDLIQKFSVLFVLGMFFGCISMLDSNGAPQDVPTAPTCRTVIVQEPYTEEVCQNVSKMEEVCETITLNFSLSDINKTNICVEEGLCVNWFPNGTCTTYYCSKAMMRCQMHLTNLDTQKSGTFGISANFTLGDATFNKEEITHTIFPTESATYDFNQFYVMDINQVKADCDLSVTSDAKLQDCRIESRIFEDCANTTKYQEVEKEICN
jgi:hypothetical protein